MPWLKAFACLVCLSLASNARAQESPSVVESLPAGYDAELAESLGADDYGMRWYTLVILKTGPTPVPKGEARDAMFKGHFDNMKRLSAEGQLVLAGPLDGVDGWRGLFLFATDDIEEARQLVATDPVIQNGEMIAEYHKHYGSAALLQVKDLHDRVAKQKF